MPFIDLSLLRETNRRDRCRARGHVAAKARGRVGQFALQGLRFRPREERERLACELFVFHTLASMFSWF